MCAVVFFSRSVGEFDDSVFGSMADLQKSCAARPADHRQETTAIWEAVRDPTSCYVVSCKWCAGRGLPVFVSSIVSHSGLPWRSPVCLRDFRVRVFSNCSRSCIRWCDQQVSMPHDVGRGVLSSAVSAPNSFGASRTLFGIVTMQSTTTTGADAAVPGSSPAASAAVSPFITGLPSQASAPAVSMLQV